ncbi:DUF1801 domain-containing protein [Ohtaekwangia koreensis]|uniref:YdhG-like domain-containing protein n=1 Tax=Ohtaekwangia koreensis TaxID=688867 RepID=A0A1T5KE00_9BACT|nr:DUF1801 domain-containing protein [Ohtaekwangia koreensis]SKC61655.1 protein of unknown function (DU1801) [Ohtaekwangia koreensis]
MAKKAASKAAKTVKKSIQKPAKKTAKKVAAKTTKVSNKDINDTPKVNVFLKDLKHPLKPELEALRSIIMNANSKLSERIKWNAPSFFYKEDMAAFNMRSQTYILIVFIFYNGAMIDDNTGLLEGDYKDRRLAKFFSMEDVLAKKATLEKVVNQWVRLIEQ